MLVISAGTFEDPDTSSVVHDEVAGIRISQQVQEYLDGARDTKEDDEEQEQEDPEEDD